MKTKSPAEFGSLVAVVAAILIWLLFLAAIYHLQNPVTSPGWQDIFAFGWNA